MEAVMDAREFFQNVVVPRYTEFVRRPTDFPVFWTTLVENSAGVSSAS